MVDIPESSLPSLRGITDRASGVAKANEALSKMKDDVFRHLPKSFDFTAAHMALMSLLTRAYAFHLGATAAADADNPWAAFTLLRSYAENAAMLVWLVGKPNELGKLTHEAGPEARFRLGKILSYASRRMGGFEGIYDQLSGFAHPTASTALSGWHARGDQDVSWASVPAFKNDDDFMMACVWLVELAEANSELWLEVWDLYFGPSPRYSA
jgi:hypothetical protein